MIIHCTVELGPSPSAMMDRPIIVSANKTLRLLWVVQIPTFPQKAKTIALDLLSARIKIAGQI
jgi:hypothetical protein